MRESLRYFLHELDEAVFPSSIYCISCGAMIDRSRSYSLCDDCILRFHWITGRICQRCGKAMPDTSRGRLCYDCMQEDHLFARGFSCLTYGLHERELMMDLKYAGKGYLARIFGQVMFDRLEPEIRQGLFSPAGGGMRIDLIAPVPVSRGRLRKRGYNQSAIMARILARCWRDCVRAEHADCADYADCADCSDCSDCSDRAERTGGVWRAASGREQALGFGRNDATKVRSGLFPAPAFREDLLCRTRETVMLRSLGPAERRMALKGAFAVTPAGRRLLAAGENPSGPTILLVDDIYTTGATADACSRVLLEGGAGAVYLCSLASGGNRRPEGL